MDNIGLMEINEIRPFFTKAFFEIQKLRPAAAGDPSNNNAYDYDHYGNSSLGMDGRYGGGSMADFDGKASYSSSTVPESSRRFQSTQGSRMN